MLSGTWLRSSGVSLRPPGTRRGFRRCSQGAGVINTASSERLDATVRARLASLTRRGRALARRTLTLHHGMYLIGTVYNCCTPHASLAHIGDKTTPAMAMGITGVFARTLQNRCTTQSRQ